MGIVAGGALLCRDERDARRTIIGNVVSLFGAVEPRNCGVLSGKGEATAKEPTLIVGIDI